MAATKKSTKRSARKSSKAKSTASRKKSAARPASKRKVKKPKTAKRSPRGGLDGVLRAGGKTWKRLKSTTTQVMEGVKDTLAGER
jgi:hypothetical protein